MNTTLTFRDYLNKTFSIMGLGLAISTVIAYLIGSNIYAIYRALGSLASLIMIFACIGELILAVYFTRRLMHMSKQTAWVCFIGYAILTGITLSTIIASYTGASVVFALASTSILFVCMSIIGSTTDVDFTKGTSLLSAGLITMLVMTLLNTFIFHSSAISMLLLYAGVIIFLVLIAYDTQRIRDIYNSGFYDSEMNEKMQIMAAFQLYLDFINLFIRVLQIFGRRRDN